MTESRPDDWFTIGWDAWMLGAESAMVIGLRSVTLAMGGAQAQQEARHMVIEKVEAGTALGVALASGKLGSSAESVTRGTVSHYSKMVRANRKRLTNG